VIRKKGVGAEEEPEDVGVVIQHLKSVSFGLVMLFRLIHALNLS
jgi:hypothetical protein